MLTPLRATQSRVDYAIFPWLGGVQCSCLTVASSVLFQYIFIGGREREETLDFSAATEWHLKNYTGLIAEVSNVWRLGTLRGENIGDRVRTETTIGIFGQVNKFLKFEQGVVYKEHGTRHLGARLCAVMEYRRRLFRRSAYVEDLS